jgi:uridine phosphorylase
MADRFHSAEIVKTQEGRQYHIGLAPKEVAPRVLLCGDPARAKRVAALFDQVTHEISNREYLTFTGTYQNLPLSVMATGMGCDNTEIAVIELAQILDDFVLLRIGSSGALQKNINLADLVVSTGGVRLENTSTSYVMEGFPALSHYEVLLALIQAVDTLHYPFHVGLTATAPGFYGGQARHVPGFPPRYPDLLEQLEKVGVQNMEMETSTLFTLAQLRPGIRAGAVCAIYASRHQNQFIDTETKSEAENRCIQTGLKALTLLAEMDQQKGKQSWWHPSVSSTLSPQAPQRKSKKKSSQKPSSKK